MKPLIKIDSELYKRRLVREINSLLRRGQSVYASDSIQGCLRKLYAVAYSTPVALRCSSATAACFYSKHFEDGSGKEIVVSRESPKSTAARASRAEIRANCEKCSTRTNWCVEVGGRSAYWCGCGN